MKTMLSKIPVVATIFALVAGSSAFAAAPTTNPYEALLGSVKLTRGVVENGLKFASVSFSGEAFRNKTGAAIATPAEGSSVAVAGTEDTPEKLTNKELLQAMVDSGAIDTIKGYTIRFIRLGSTNFLQAYNKSNPGGPKGIVDVPASLVTLDVEWAKYLGVYDGSASLTASATASGTYNYISTGRLVGYTLFSGKALDIDYAGVGTFRDDNRKGITGQAEVSGRADAPQS